jgi:ubiquinone/menaquinone biosynthesis C-methylase UbiE
MTSGIVMNDREALTAVVYGDTFALYDETAFEAFLAPLRKRLAANGISPDVFRGKRCLDAGCGGGRGSILMAEAAALEVVGIDLSPTNIESCTKRAAQKGLSNLTFQRESLASLPFADASFDIVWCNGVLHHTAQPDQGLKEITRVLKPGGHMWLYLYGSGGIYWYVIDWIRGLLRGVNVRECIWQLRVMEMPVGRIAEWIDDWFTGDLRRYTRADVVRRLDELGFTETAVLDRGVTYDTSERRVGAGDRERQLMGEGDVRNFCRKSGTPSGDRHVLPDPPDRRGSPYEDGPSVTQFGPPLAAISDTLDVLERACGHQINAYRILVARSVHSRVRSLLEDPRAFDEAALHQHLAGVSALLREFAR